jgi:hypothetical protein
VGEALLRHFRIQPKTPLAHAYTPIDFEEAARRYGRSAPRGRVRCCSMGATPGRARPPRCGPAART